MTEPTPINVVLCESFRVAMDALAAKSDWKRVSVSGRWLHEGDEYRIITQANQLRGHRIMKMVSIGQIPFALQTIAHDQKVLSRD